MARSLQIDSFGDPSVVHLVEVPSQALAPGEVRVRLEAAPLNPSDFLLIAGRYGIRPELPSAVGAEGVGTVVEVGPDVVRTRTGQRVLVLPSEGVGTWQDEVIVDQRSVVSVHRDADPLQLATIPINGATAQLLLDAGGPLSRGAWVLQTAANSGLGAFVRVLAEQAGLRVLDVVRSAAAADDLRTAGADHVVVSDDGLRAALAEVLGSEQVPLVLDGVGGPVIDAVLPHLSVGGQIVGYAALSGRPVVVPPGTLTFKGIRLHGFWLQHWLTTAPRDEIDRLYLHLIDLVADGVLTTPIDATYSLDDHAQAIAHARSFGRTGKVLFAATSDGPTH